MRTRYVYRNGKLVEKNRAQASYSVMSDIQPFITQDGVEISSRSSLREYERRNGVKQTGNDWTGSQRPAFWDIALERRRGNMIDI